MPDLIQRALTAQTFVPVRRRLFRQLLESLLYERALRPTRADAGRTCIEGIDVRGEPVSYVFDMHVRHGFDRVAIGPQPVCRRAGGDDRGADSVPRFLGDVRDSLQASPERLAGFARELEETLVKDALARYVFERRPDAPPTATHDALEAQITDGHRYHPAYKSRLGFDVADNLAYGPEYAAPLRPLWLAARRSIAQLTHDRGVGEGDVLREQLGATLDGFHATIRAAGEDPDAFV